MVVVSTVVQCALHLREACITYTVYEELRKTTAKKTRDEGRRKEEGMEGGYVSARRTSPPSSFSLDLSMPLSRERAFSTKEEEEDSLQGPARFHEKEEDVEWKEVCTDLIGFNSVDLSKPLYPAVEVNVDGAVVEFI